MRIYNEWQPIAARSTALAKAAAIEQGYASIDRNDIRSRSTIIGSEARSILSSIAAFVDRNKQTIPLQAYNAGANLDPKPLPTGQVSEIERDYHWKNVLLAIKAEAEISYLLKDLSSFIRTRSERAFRHLVRSLHVDIRLSDSWHTAFCEERGEDACEKLGAIHLLLHGVYAFKVNSSGARSDLIFNEIPNEDEILAEAMILTEWKVCDNDPHGVEGMRQPVIAC